ncbi:hypothetical protein Patl1_19584 [Pistacia atlantica]|uniref:Uncharacterized protein n=1 Tax=Pistacia atlantica TaxID=434234 RepID=A0ACC1C1V8_9ROSI|nr:hypothetical protein Patl1_19584 [Pistacia atlantica]
MVSLQNFSGLCKIPTSSFHGVSLPRLPPLLHMRGRVVSQSLYRKENCNFPRKQFGDIMSNRARFTIPRSSSNSSDSNSSKDESSGQNKAYTFWVLKEGCFIDWTWNYCHWIWLKKWIRGRRGASFIYHEFMNGKFALSVWFAVQFVGVDSLQAGNVVELVIVLGLTLGWVSTYIFRVSNKEMTYAQQLRDYENKVMEKRLEGLTEAELEVLLEQVEEEKRRLASGEQVN